MIGILYKCDIVLYAHDNFIQMVRYFTLACQLNFSQQADVNARIGLHEFSLIWTQRTHVMLEYRLSD